MREARPCAAEVPGHRLRRARVRAARGDRPRRRRGGDRGLLARVPALAAGPRPLPACSLCVSDCPRRACGRPSGRCSAARGSAAPCTSCSNMLGHCAKAQQPMIATAIRQVFGAASGAEARERLAEVVDRLEGPAPEGGAPAARGRGRAARLLRLSQGALAKLRSTDENVKGRAALLRSGAAITLPCGRGRPPSEEQGLGLVSPAAQRVPQRTSRVAPRWRRPRPASPDPSLASRRRGDGRPVHPGRRARSRAGAPP